MYDEEVSPPRLPWIDRFMFWFLSLFRKEIEKADEDHDELGRY